MNPKERWSLVGLASQPGDLAVTGCSESYWTTSPLWTRCTHTTTTTTTPGIPSFMDHQTNPSFIFYNCPALAAPQFPQLPLYYQYSGTSAEQLDYNGTLCATAYPYLDQSWFTVPVPMPTNSFNTIGNLEAIPSIDSLSSSHLLSFENTCTQPLPQCYDFYQNAAFPSFCTTEPKPPSISPQTNYSEYSPENSENSENLAPLASSDIQPSFLENNTGADVPIHLRSRVAAAKSRKKRREAEQKLNEAHRRMVDKRIDMVEQEKELRREMHALRDQMRMHSTCGENCRRLVEYLNKTEHWDNEEESKVVLGLVV
ncbi:hypothetical protein QBC38DRAFT_134099 [Podospora fimiseda]|uniref:BZIP domain-containing protein n=1 Tax=Podospora fimiseda TaxID=252190 RepID=A0AAN6YR81_9PEZI|nr:hypothetical protein QBC38DRAFT_134099 [Podospora fimiseda]